MNLSLRARLFCLLPSLLSAAAVTAHESATAPVWEAAFERIGLKQGLSQSVVNSIHRDELGFLWFGTQEGLNRYDGHEFTVYRHDPDDPASLSSSSIETIAGDDRGRIWLGTDDGGVNILDPRSGEITVVRHEPATDNELSHDRVLAIAFGPDGSAWLGTEQGLDRIDSRTGSIERRSRLAGKAVTSVLVGEDGRVWAGTRESGLFVLDDGRLTHYATGQPAGRRLAGDRVTDLARGRRGAIWVTTRDGGLDRITAGGESEPRPGQAGDLAAGMTAIDIDDAGNLLVGSESGDLYRLTPDRRVLARYRHRPGDPDSIAPGAVLDIHVDRSGVIWTGSYAGGVSRTKPLSGKVAHRVAGLEELPSRIVRAFWIDEHPRALWIGTNAGLVQVTEGPDDYRVFEHDPDDPRSLSHEVVYALHRRDNGQMWVGTRRGLNRFRPESATFDRYLAGDGRGLPDNRVRDLAEDAKGRLWVATEGGLARYDDAADRFTTFRSSPDGLSSDEVTSLHVDDEGFLWIGTNIAGLNRLDPETGLFTRYRAGPDGLSHHSVWDILRTGDQVWVGTFSGGANLIDLASGRVTHFLEDNGLANNVVYRIVEDTRERLWMSTNAGLSVFDPETGRFLNYNPRDGLLNHEYNSNAAFADAQGRLWFGGIDGIDIIDAPAVETSPSSAVAALTGFRLFNRPVDPDADDRVELDARIEHAETLVLDHTARVFSIGISALHFVNPDTNRLRYRLDGLHDDWLETRAGVREVTFNALDPGQYRLRVQAAARGTEWGPERTLGIRVLPPPWRSPAAHAAYAGAVLVLLALIVGAYRRRLGAQRRRVEKLNAMVAERTTELEGLNRQLSETNRRLEVATRHDPLTGLANRRALLEWLPHQQAASRRVWQDWLAGGRSGPEPAHARLWLLAVDLDDFKRINDTRGHLIGDEVLCGAAKRLRAQVRASDLVVRWGGEEFLVVMQASGPDGARSQAERIRASIATRPLQPEDGEPVSLTCSIGFACYPFSPEHPDVGDWEEIIGLADAALYAAKASGKNAWRGIGCPEGLSAAEVQDLMRDPEVRKCTGDRAIFWRSGD